MKVASAGLVLFAAVLFFSAGAFGDDKKGAVKVKLPTGWSKLGLSEEQKNRILTIQSEFNPKIADLEKQIKELRSQESTEMKKVLTDGQKTQLRKLALDKAGVGDEKSGGDKK